MAKQIYGFEVYRMFGQYHMEVDHQNTGRQITTVSVDHWWKLLGAFLRICKELYKSLPEDDTLDTQIKSWKDSQYKEKAKHE